MEPTKVLVDYVVDAKYEDFPKEVIDKAKTCMLDSLGCILGGYRTRLGETIVNLVKELGGKEESTIVGNGVRVPSIHAAFANAAMANALDYDETYIGIGHTGSALIPAALAIGEKLRSSGKDFLTSVIVAYEVVNRIGRAIQPSPEREKQVWGIGTWHTFGAVAAASKLLGLNADETTNAFGIAGATSPLPCANKWGWDDRPLHWVKEPIAWPAHAGVLAALLAEKGFIGCRNILDGDKGYWIMSGSDRCNFDKMMEGLGQEYEILKISFKPYPACRYIHSTLDALKKIIQEQRLKAGDIKQVKVKSISWIGEFMDYEPKTMVDAEFSVPYAVAMIVLGEAPGPDWFTPERLRDPEVLEIARRVVFEKSPEAERVFFTEKKPASTVEVTAKDGRVFSQMVKYAKGDPRNPITRDEQEDKFRRLASFVLEPERIRKVIKTVDRLNELDDVFDLISLLYR